MKARRTITLAGDVHQGLNDVFQMAIGGVDMSSREVCASDETAAFAKESLCI